MIHGICRPKSGFQTSPGSQRNLQILQVMDNPPPLLRRGRGIKEFQRSLTCLALLRRLKAAPVLNTFNPIESRNGKTLRESDHFTVKSQRQPFPNFEGYVSIPDPFPLEKRLYKPLCLTDVEAGLYRQKADRNLSEIARYLLDNLEIADVGGQLAIFQQPDWKILNPQSAKRELLAFIVSNYPEIGKFLGSRQLEEIIERLLCSPEIRHLEHLPAADPHTLCCSDQLYVWPNGRRFEASSRDLRFSHLEVASTEIGPVPTPYFDDFLRTVAEDDEDLCSLILEIIGVIIAGFPVQELLCF